MIREMSSLDFIVLVNTAFSTIEETGIPSNSERYSFEFGKYDIVDKMRGFQEVRIKIAINDCNKSLFSRKIKRLY